MSFDLPPSIKKQVQEFAQAQQISDTEALIRLIQDGLSVLTVPMPKPDRPSYASMFGAVKNGYGSVEAIDKAIAGERDAW